ncbi:S-adenosyl-L-methionine-dependent methyltransferase superfamily protein [Cucumis melo var. makuwa]|uniref:S-adenosyl-L-methionine-dependent methyltransferase superfamily protein n=1 Tax=Cucumis melo var. makuwa TaxID=1194695 RepID=A0A5A7U6S4_CUCMM|nr:S-adenosyl-L-methionine-dependent methyltransferase superfamily protein [Cucumis melo var. makuwa]TYK17349.1 S-adenosyl-L-methionine-dependent methyltransferase superfamily protein [Cucumis melo var. makuwa]
MWRRAAGLVRGFGIRRFSDGTRRRIEDEGDWFYASEWWGNDHDSDAHTVFRSISEKGNGVVSVLTYPSSRPNGLHWPGTGRWLQQRYAEVCSGCKNEGRFGILGYQWRVLRFNDNTRQSTAKVLAAYRESEPELIFLMQQAHCLAVPYLKSMISVGLTTIASCGYDLLNAIRGKQILNILCIGHGGGSLPLFLASKIQGANVDIVEIDPLVISASIQAMGFPAFSVMTASGDRSSGRPRFIDDIMWKGIHERLFLYELDAEDFISNTTNLYDMVFIDAYDGDDIFPHKLWDPNSTFLEALTKRVHPKHGTVVVNLHSDSDIVEPDGSVPSVLEHILPMGKYVSQIGRAYMDVLVGDESYEKNSGLGFTVAVPWVCNTSLVVCKGLKMNCEYLNRDSVMNTLISKSLEVERLLKLPFSCLEYIKRGFVLLD